MIIGGSFNGARTQTHKVKDVVRWGHEAQALSPLLSMTSEARSRIADVLKAERGATELMERLHAIAKIEGRYFTEGRSLEDAVKRLREAAANAEGLFNHAVFATVLEEVRPQGLLPLVEERQKGRRLTRCTC
jgi:hypothetical protein